MFDSGKESHVLEGTKAERRYHDTVLAERSTLLKTSDAYSRFLALNVHGTLDYCLPGEGNISEYLGTSR